MSFTVVQNGEKRKETDMDPLVELVHERPVRPHLLEGVAVPHELVAPDLRVVPRRLLAQKLQ